MYEVPSDKKKSVYYRDKIEKSNCGADVIILIYTSRKN